MSVFPQEARLLELFGQATELAEGLLERSEAQSQMLAADDLDAFNESLDRGRETIEEINGLHQEAEALMQSYALYLQSSRGDGGSGGRSEAVDAAAERFIDAVEQCAQRNTRNLDEAKEKTEEFIRQIGSLSLKRKSLGLYAQNTGNSSAHFDKKT